MTLKLYGNGNIENVDSIVTSASATLSSTELGYIDGVTSAIQTQLNNAGKILQIVRATDETNRSTTSTSFVDSNLNVTITPKKSNSAILLLANANISASLEGNGTFTYIYISITDSSNNAISGSNAPSSGYGGASLSSGGVSFNYHVTAIGYDTPATTSATTYKLRFRSNWAGNTATLANASNPAQLYAIEVGA